MYTIKALANLAGISSRTLRYYDEIDLLKPSSTNEAGYRLYDDDKVDLLQQILFYKRLDVPLMDVKKIIYDKDFNKKSALLSHKKKLVLELENLQTLIRTIDRTVNVMEGKGKMKNEEKFEGFKKALIDENERKYGNEAREKYGDHVEASNQKLMKMDEESFKRMEVLTDEMHELFAEAMENGDPSSNKAMKACEMHKQWLMNYWEHYSEEAHYNLTEMYVSDERFAAYYDKIKPGLAIFLRDAMKIYLKR